VFSTEYLFASCVDELVVCCFLSVGYFDDGGDVMNNECLAAVCIIDRYFLYHLFTSFIRLYCLLT